MTVLYAYNGNPYIWDYVLYWNETLKMYKYSPLGREVCIMDKTIKNMSGL